MRLPLKSFSFDAFDKSFIVINDADFAEAVRNAIGGDLAEVRRLLAGEAPEALQPEQRCGNCKHRQADLSSPCHAGIATSEDDDDGCYNWEPIANPEAPPVEDSLARAEKRWYAWGHEPFRAGDREDDYSKARAIIDPLIAAIRERDERAAQMMTVEEAVGWSKRWGLTKDSGIAYSDYLRRRIKERNEGAK